MDEGLALLVVGGILGLSAALALGAARTGFPVLVAFLGLGMLLGSDGPGGIEFDNAHLTREAGTVGLGLILYEGGLQTSWRRLRSVAVPAALLSTVGVVVSALITGVVAYALFDLTWLEAFLLGAVVASTDAAAVFSTLRFTHIPRRLARTLEAESGGNDPMAIALTLGLIAWIEHPKSHGFGDLAVLVGRQISIGLVARYRPRGRCSLDLRSNPGDDRRLRPGGLDRGGGALIRGRRHARRERVPGRLSRRARRGKHAVPVSTGARCVSRGCGLRRAGRPLRLARPVGVPHELPHVALPGVALAVALMLFARPAAVWVSTALSGYSTRDRVLLGWAGLRGAAPIVVATFVLESQVRHRESIFNIVFFVVVVSALVQGTTLERVAQRLRLTSPVPAAPERAAETGPLSQLDLVEFAVASNHAINGSVVRELGLPRDTLIAVIQRDGQAIPPRGSAVQADDRLFVLAPRERRPELEDVFARWRRLI